MGELKIALVQASLAWEDVDENIRHLSAMVQPILQVDIIVLPEMFVTGFSMNASVLAEESYEKGLKFMLSMAASKNCVLCGTLICKEGEGYYNRFVWVSPDGEVKHYDKRHLFTMGDEGKHYTPGKTQLTIEYKNWIIKPFICYDLRFPVWSRNTKENPFDLLIYCANWPEKRITAWSKLLQARAIENSSFVVGVNRIGEDGNGYAYNGQSMCVDYKGEPTILNENMEEVSVFTLNKQELLDFRSQFPVLNDADDFEILT